VEAAVLKAMAVETTHRWGSVTELRDALQKAGGQAKGETKLLPEIRQERGGMSPRLLAGGIVGAVLIVASLVGWLAIQGRTVPTEIQTSRIVTTAAIQSLAAETEAIPVAVITRDTQSANLSVTQTAEARRAAATRAIATQTAHALTATPSLTRTPRPTPTPTATRTPLPTSEIVAGAVISFRDEFDNLKISSWAEGTNVTMKDGRLWITGHETWDGVYRDSNMRENEGILILFRFSENSTFEIFVQSGEWETPALRRWGIYGERNSFSPNVYQESEYTGGNWWTGSMEPAAGRWYFLLLEIGGRDEFAARIWDRDNPGQYLEMRQSMGPGWADRTWHIGVATYSGILELDSYQELDFSSVLSGTPTSAAPSAANCPAWFATPEPGKGVLVIENHLGMELYVDATYTSKSWTLPAKQGDTPGRVLLQLPPGHYEYNEHTASGGRGHIGVDIQAGQMLVSPTGSTCSAEQPAYPLEFPQGCP
jgi:hypothetical protein